MDCKIFEGRWTPQWFSILDLSQKVQSYHLSGLSTFLFSLHSVEKALSKPVTVKITNITWRALLITYRYQQRAEANWLSNCCLCVLLIWHYSRWIWKIQVLSSTAMTRAKNQNQAVREETTKVLYFKSREDLIVGLHTVIKKEQLPLLMTRMIWNKSGYSWTCTLSQFRQATYHKKSCLFFNFYFIKLFILIGIWSMQLYWQPYYCFFLVDYINWCDKSREMTQFSARNLGFQFFTEIAKSNILVQKPQLSSILYTNYEE